MKKVPAVYMIKNLVTGKAYIGKTKNAYNRLRDHMSMLKNKNHHSTYLRNASIKYGESAFVFGIIEEYPIEQLDSMELYWITYYDTFKSGYNESLPNGKKDGRLWTDDDRREFSVLMKERMSRISEEKKKQMYSNRKTSKEETRKVGISIYDYATLSFVRSFENYDKCAEYLNTTRKAIRRALEKFKAGKKRKFKGFVLIREYENIEDFIEKIYLD